MRYTTTTQRVLHNMFTENTGRHILDSGDAYGRHWERNQDKNFMDVPESTFELATWHYRDDKKVSWEINYTRNAFHYCSEHLHFEKDLDRSWLRFAQKPENESTGWVELMHQWVEKKFEGEATGIYNEGEPFILNTYNEDNNLSQTLQFMFFEFDGEGYYILQIHGGFDVRGGYSTPRVFSGNGFNELGLLSNLNEGALYCSDCESRWYQEGAYGFINNEYSKLNIDKDMSVIEIDNEKDWNDRPAINEKQLELIAGCGPNRIGIIRVFEGKASCPKCGRGILCTS